MSARAASFAILCAGALLASGCGSRAGRSPKPGPYSGAPRKLVVTPYSLAAMEEQGGGGAPVITYFPFGHLPEFQPYGTPLAAEVAVGNALACQRMRDGLVRCWGDALSWFDGKTIARKSMVMPVISGASHVAVAGDMGCAVLAGGAAACWGRSNYFRPAERVVDPFVPVPLPGLTGAASISLGYEGACARMVDGTVVCWGNNEEGLVGQPASAVQGCTPIKCIIDRPTPIPGLRGVVDVSTGHQHACAVLGDGTVQCWGQNARGQLGDCTRNPRLSPVSVVGLKGATRVVAGREHTCALLRDGRVACWGGNAVGQLGDGMDAPRCRAAAVPGLSGVVEIAGYYDAMCARSIDNVIRCWGDHLARIFESTRGNVVRDEVTEAISRSPIVSLALPLEFPIAQMSVGPDASCAVLADGQSGCFIPSGGKARPLPCAKVSFDGAEVPGCAKPWFSRDLKR